VSACCGDRRKSRLPLIFVIVALATAALVIVADLYL
jgi:hypothetical protein